jgi:HAD superfamily hydrolase (TIGR01509 family)
VWTKIRKMICYVFDLDDTLLQTTRLQQSNFNFTAPLQSPTKKQQPLKHLYDTNIPSEPVLNRMLSGLRGLKIVLTNSSGNHAKYSLEAMNINRNFLHIVNANSLNFIMKPHPTAYLRTEQLIKRTNPFLPWKFIFFDDLIENLKSAKLMGWVTVLIHKEFKKFSRQALQGVDYVFYDIYQALHYFNSMQRQRTKK